MHANPESQQRLEHRYSNTSMRVPPATPPADGCLARIDLTVALAKSFELSGWPASGRARTPGRARVQLVKRIGFSSERRPSLRNGSRRLPPISARAGRGRRAMREPGSPCAAATHAGARRRSRAACGTSGAERSGRSGSIEGGGQRGAPNAVPGRMSTPGTVSGGRQQSGYYRGLLRDGDAREHPDPRRWRRASVAPRFRCSPPPRATLVPGSAMRSKGSSRVR